MGHFLNTQYSALQFFDNTMTVSDRRRPLLLLVRIAALSMLLWNGTWAWPDGAPCLQKVMEDMYPAAKEHEGGLQTDEAPFRITFDPLCFHPGTSITGT